MTESAAQTEALGRRLAGELRPSGTLLLYGDLGSGKTVLARGVAAGLGIDPEQVQSPTFTLVREHSGDGGRLVHLDLYRLAPEEVAGLGLEELLEESAVKVVEWAQRLPAVVEADIRLELVRPGDGGERREIRELAAVEMASETETEER